MMKRFIAIAAMALLAVGLQAQFTGPAGPGQATSVAQVREARLGSYVTLVGHIVEHRREDYYTFRDATGSIRLQIDPEVWQHRPVSPSTQVRVKGEIEWALAGRYISVESLQIVQ